MNAHVGKELLVSPSWPLTFQPENYYDMRGEFDQWIDVHWRELGLDHDAVPLDKDEDLYCRLADAGALAVVTARQAGRLVGYHISIVKPHLHYRSTLFAFVDVYWLHPSCRRGLNGLRLLQAAEHHLKARGVKKVTTATKMHLDVGVLFERMGWRETERVYTKLLGD